MTFVADNDPYPRLSETYSISPPGAPVHDPESTDSAWAAKLLKQAWAEDAVTVSCSEWEADPDAPPRYVAVYGQAWNTERGHFSERLIGMAPKPSRERRKRTETANVAGFTVGRWDWEYR